MYYYDTKSTFGPQDSEGLAQGTAVVGTSPCDHLLHVPVLVGRHLRQTQHGVLTAQAVVVRLFARVHATARLAARLGRRELLETRGHDGVQFLVLAPVRHHLVGVRAHELALQTVEMRRFVLTSACEIEGKKKRKLIDKPIKTRYSVILKLSTRSNTNGRTEYY